MRARSKGKGKIRNATRTVYDNIQFRSKLEVYCYKKLKESNIEALYEQVQYELIEAFTFDNKWLESSKTGLKLDPTKVRPMTYTPDFVGDKWIIECKGFANEQWSLKRKLIKLFLANKGIDVYVPSNTKQVDEVIKIIQNGK
jgi:hypothetical protein